MTKYGMASQSSSSEVTSRSKPNSSAPIAPDASSHLVTNHKLHGHNFLQWSQSVFMYICGRGTNGHLISEISAPEKQTLNTGPGKLMITGYVMAIKFHDHGGWRKLSAPQNSQGNMGGCTWNIFQHREFLRIIWDWNQIIWSTTGRIECYLIF